MCNQNTMGGGNKITISPALQAVDWTKPIEFVTADGATRVARVLVTDLKGPEHRPVLIAWKSTLEPYPEPKEYLERVDQYGRTDVHSPRNVIVVRNVAEPVLIYLNMWVDGPGTSHRHLEDARRAAQCPGARKYKFTWRLDTATGVADKIWLA